jgi:hypothetical protein
MVHPLLMNPQIIQQQQAQGAPMTGGAELAALLANPPRPIPYNPPSTAISSLAMQKLAEMLKPQATDPVRSNMPGQTVDPRTGMGSTPLGHDPYAQMTPEQMAAQTSSNLPFGQGPSAQFNPVVPAATPGWFDQGGAVSRMFGSGDGTANTLPPVTNVPNASPPVASSASGPFDQGGALSWGLLAKLFGGGS